MHGRLEDAEFDHKFDVVLCSEMICYPSDTIATIRKLNSLGHFILVTYTTYESDRLDRIFSRIPSIYTDSCGYFGLFDSGRLVNWQRSRIVLWWSGALPAEIG